MRRQKQDAELGFHKRWRPALMSFFLRRVHEHAEAEDLTQEVFIRLLGSDANIESPDAYVFQIAANLLRDRGRRHKVRNDYLTKQGKIEGIKVEELDPSRVAEGRETLAAIANGLDELPQRTRDIFTLYRVENLDQRAIAETFGISRSAVRKHVIKAMAHLMARMRAGQ